MDLSKHYPLSEICVFHADNSSALALGRDLTRFRFSALIFNRFDALSAFLRSSPLTAGVVLMDPNEEQVQALKGFYRGRIIVPDRPGDIDSIVQSVRQMHREQMMIDDPGVIRVLRTLDRFLDGNPAALMVNGPPAGLDRALEFVKTFAPRPLEAAPLNSDPRGRGLDTIYYARGIFKRPLEEQVKWSLKYISTGCRVLLLERSSLAELDEAYLDGKLHESLFELLSVQALNVEGLDAHSVESLSVQPPKFFAPQIHMMDEGESRPAAKLPKADRPKEPEPVRSEPVDGDSSQKKSFFKKLFGN